MLTKFVLMNIVLLIPLRLMLKNKYAYCIIRFHENFFMKMHCLVEVGLGTAD